ncbi:MAG: ATP-dependent Clp protease adaptor ClpS [Defluviitaleaceae bacterium]|nr:ATP-dependent Clp protease adaptor ClpS [Defluviitaleaceae bacterium]
MPKNPYAGHFSDIEIQDALDVPKLYGVKLHNDDYTPMDFVVRLLVTVFRKSEVDAAVLMLAVHEKGESLVGVYSYDIAATKVMQAQRMADAAGFPLRITMGEVAS